jgi:hypothetical protein
MAMELNSLCQRLEADRGRLIEALWDILKSDKSTRLMRDIVYVTYPNER